MTLYHIKILSMYNKLLKAQVNVKVHGINKRAQPGFIVDFILRFSSYSEALLFHIFGISQNHFAQLDIPSCVGQAVKHSIMVSFILEKSCLNEVLPLYKNTVLYCNVSHFISSKFIPIAKFKFVA